MKRAAVLLTLVLLLALTACSRDQGGEQMSGGVPDLVLPSVDGSIVRLSDYRGKVLLVDFWATWCPPCQEMIPVLSGLHRAYGSKGLVVLGVALDREGLEILGPFVHENQIPYKVLLGDNKVSAAFGGVQSIPTLFIVDREGRLVRKLVGFHSAGELEGQIKRYL